MTREVLSTLLDCLCEAAWAGWALSQSQCEASSSSTVRLVHGTAVTQSQSVHTHSLTWSRDSLGLPHWSAYLHGFTEWMPRKRNNWEIQNKAVTKASQCRNLIGTPEPQLTHHLTQVPRPSENHKRIRKTHKKARRENPSHPFEVIMKKIKAR